MNGGSPPTALNARTGLFTPPGITFFARSNSAADFDRSMRGVIARAARPGYHVGMANGATNELYREVRKSEILRAEILMVLFAALIVLFNIIFFIGEQTFGSVLPLRIMVTGVLAV